MDHLSSSQVTLYLQCPRKYRFRYLDGLEPPFKSSAMAFGSAIHSSISYLAQERKRGNGVNLAKLISTFRADWQAQKCDKLRYKEGETEGEFLEKGVALLQQVFEESKEWKIKATEMPFRVPVVDPETGEEVLPVPLEGFIDLLLEPDTLIEFKTGLRKWDEESVKNNLQVSFYHYAYWLLYGKEPEVKIKVLLRQKTPRIDTLPASRGKEDIAWAINLLREVFESIKKGAFHPSPGWLCSDCEFGGPCKATNGKKGGENVK